VPQGDSRVCKRSELVDESRGDHRWRLPAGACEINGSNRKIYLPWPLIMIPTRNMKSAALFVNRKIAKTIGTLTLILSGFSASRCGATVYHSDGSAANVQALHNAVLNGDTITLPVGSFTWPTSVTISKAIKLQGTGSGRIIGWSGNSQTFGTGTKTFIVQNGFAVANGTTLRIWQTTTNKDTR